MSSLGDLPVSEWNWSEIKEWLKNNSLNLITTQNKNRWEVMNGTDLLQFENPNEISRHFSIKFGPSFKLYKQICKLREKPPQSLKHYCWWWYDYDGEVWRKYKNETAYQIENAYKKKLDYVVLNKGIFENTPNEYWINFSNLNAIFQGYRRSVTRTIIKKKLIPNAPRIPYCEPITIQMRQIIPSIQGINKFLELNSNNTDSVMICRAISEMQLHPKMLTEESVLIDLCVNITQLILRNIDFIMVVNRSESKSLDHTIIDNFKDQLDSSFSVWKFPQNHQNGQNGQNDQKDFIQPIWSALLVAYERKRFDVLFIDQKSACITGGIIKNNSKISHLSVVTNLNKYVKTVQNEIDMKTNMCELDLVVISCLDKKLEIYSDKLHKIVNLLDLLRLVLPTSQIIPKQINFTTPSFGCPICEELLNNPVTTSCGHNFCKRCWDKWRSGEHRTCPICRTICPEKLSINIDIRDYIREQNPVYSHYQEHKNLRLVRWK